MSDLSAAQALKEATTLRQDFASHELMKTRLSVLARDSVLGDSLEALGISSQKLQNVVPWASDAPNQEGALYATALSLADPEVQVYVQSEQPSKQSLGEQIESFNQAVVDQLLANDYDVMRDVACKGVGFRRLDEAARFFGEQPKRKKGQAAEAYNIEVDDYRKSFGLPFCMSTVDPQTIFYVENRERSELEFVVEWTKTRESLVKTGGDPNIKGDLLIVRDRKIIYHFWVAQSDAVESGSSSQDAWGNPAAADVIFTGPNRFNHTGYFMYRGLYTGLSDPQRRYDPYILVTLNNAQHRSLFATLQANFAVQAGVHWLEHDLPRDMSAQGRAVTADRKANTRGAQSRSEHGGVAAEFEPGAHVRFRDLAGDYGKIIEMLDAEEDKYRFKDILMGEADSGDSGRAIIRKQEAAGRRLAPGYRQRKLATEEILRVIRHTLFENSEYLGGKQNASRVYIARFMDGIGEDGQLRKQDVILLSAEHNIPHEVRVQVEARSQAAQLAWMEEGRAMKGELSRDTIDQDFYAIKDKQLENTRRYKDMIRDVVLPKAAEQGVAAALDDLTKATIKNRPLVMQPATNGAEPPPPTGLEPSVTDALPGAPQMPPQNALDMVMRGASTPGGPTRPQGEDAGTSLSVNGAGIG